MKLAFLILGNLGYEVGYVFGLLNFGLLFSLFPKIKVIKGDLKMLFVLLTLCLVVNSSTEYMFNMGSLSSIELGYSHIKMYAYWYIIGMSLRGQNIMFRPMFRTIFIVVIVISSVILNLSISIVDGKAYNYLMFVDELVFLLFLTNSDKRSAFLSWLTTALSGSRSAMLAYSMSVRTIRRYVFVLALPFALLAPLVGAFNGTFLSRITFTSGLADYSLVHRLLLFSEGIASLRDNFFVNDVFWHLLAYDTTTLYIHNFLSFFQVWGGLAGLLLLAYIISSMLKIYRNHYLRRVVLFILLMLLFFRSYNWHIVFGFIAYYTYKIENRNFQYSELE